MTSAAGMNQSVALRVQFGHLPSQKLYPNELRKVHWAVRAEAEREARREGYLLAKSVWPPREPLEKATVEYVFYLKTRKRRDIDGMVSAMKPYLDSLVDAGVLRDDDCWHLAVSGARAVWGTEAKVELIIREVEE